MTYRVLIRKTGEEVEVWAPGIKGCAARGATEAEALERLKEAIRTKASRGVRSAPAVEVRTIEVELPGEAQPRAPVKEEAEGARLGGRSLVFAGVGVALLGVTGVLFYSMLAKQFFAPLYLFLPMVVLALGVVTIVLGSVAMSSDSH